MRRELRKELISKIESTRNSKVIAYVTSDRKGLSGNIAGDAVSIIHRHILALPENDRTKLDLFLYSRGGDSDTPWSIVSMLREYSAEGSFSVLIPYRAHSAATVIALGADEIVMTKKGELGPIDITISSGPYNPRETGSGQPLPISVEDVMGYFRLLDKIGCERSDEKLVGFGRLTENVNPLVLGTVNRLLEQTQLVALRLLGTRAQPFPEEKNRVIVQRLSSEIYSHRHTISRTEALSHLELDQVVKAEDQGIDSDLWALYEAYRDIFEFDTPFSPEEYLISENEEDSVWENLPIACVESHARIDIFRQDIHVKRLRQIPPQLSLQVSPNITVPDDLAGVPIEQIMQILQQILQPLIQKSVDDAVSRLISSLPVAGFERVGFNSGWREEND